MNVINFNDLNNVDVSFENIFSMTQTWENYSKFNMLNPRKNNALLYFYGCEGVYKFKNSNIDNTSYNCYHFHNHIGGSYSGVYLKTQGSCRNNQGSDL